MNRLRETAVACRWRNAGCWRRPIKLAGKPDVAKSHRRTAACRPSCSPTANPYTFGSLLRDRAIVLQGLTLLGRSAEADKLLRRRGGAAGERDWYSTQSVAFALVAVAQTTGTKPFTGFSFDYAGGQVQGDHGEGRRAAGVGQTTAAVRGRHSAVA